MDLAKWKKRRYLPEWGGNREDPEPVCVVFVPPTVGWIARWREIAMSVPLVARQGSEVGPGFFTEIKEWTKTVSTFRAEFFEAHVVAVEDLTLDGKAVGLDEALAFIDENEGLREEVFKMILEEGSVTTAEGKASG